jgi:hypothetical protein
VDLFIHGGGRGHARFKIGRARFKVEGAGA